MKPLKRILLASLFVLAAILLAACGAATPMPVPMPTPIAPLLSQELDIPTLIAQAFARGETTHEEQWLYLAYALYEYKSLPPQYLSYVEWSGTLYAEELGKVVNAPTRLCLMSPYVRSELPGLVKKTEVDIVCN